MALPFYRLNRETFQLEAESGGQPISTTIEELSGGRLTVRENSFVDRVTGEQIHDFGTEGDIAIFRAEGDRIVVIDPRARSSVNQLGIGAGLPSIVFTGELAVDGETVFQSEELFANLVPAGKIAVVTGFKNDQPIIAYKDARDPATGRFIAVLGEGQRLATLNELTDRAIKARLLKEQRTAIDALVNNDALSAKFGWETAYDVVDTIVAGIHDIQVGALFEL